MKASAKKTQQERLNAYKKEILMMMVSLDVNRTRANEIINLYEKYITNNWLGTGDIPIVTASMAARLILRAVEPESDKDGL
ncbi:hypothetical protein [Limosilactobacillus mucosae]|uniref:Uncharacterized protein n=1 Tax=Limosilactobacillus mucosae TaxID=97478 RepID=A0AAJ1HS35_LIMMU|nr:hypothetical protein [Limosilactobacillus mucosae]MDC2828482.1 hypothetical protein [Limosilactobacillus mucosae]MDC2834380.1 hypothetical protein [Limosilactobacillus mucosae]